MRHRGEPDPAGAGQVAVDTGGVQARSCSMPAALGRSGARADHRCRRPPASPPSRSRTSCCLPCRASPPASIIWFDRAHAWQIDAAREARTDSDPSPSPTNARRASGPRRGYAGRSAASRRRYVVLLHPQRRRMRHGRGARR
jgi:hypothetical protein